jgi:acyl dehydratase
MSISGYSLQTLQDFVGRELGVSDWVTIDQARIDEFAVGTTIAHGYLTLSLLSPLQNEVGVVPDDATQAINYGLDRVRFMTPVKAGARVRMHVVLMTVEDRGKGQILLKTQNTFEIEGEEKPALVAESLAFLR